MNLPLLRNSSSDMCKSILPIADTPYPQNMPALWDFLFGFLGEDQPILVGEWGGTYVNPAVWGFEAPIINEEGIDITQDLETIWNEAFVSYMVDNEIGSFYWCVNPESDDTSGLFLDDCKFFAFIIAMHKPNIRHFLAINFEFLNLVIRDSWF